MGRTMTWRHEGRLNIVVHARKRPATLEWSEYLREMSPIKHDDVRVLVISYGGGPDATQRLQLASMFDQRVQRAPVALVTDSLIARATIGALRWFNPSIRAFGLERLEAAYDYLDLTAEERERAAVIRVELERALEESADAPRWLPREDPKRPLEGR